MKRGPRRATRGSKTARAGSAAASPTDHSPESAFIEPLDDFTEAYLGHFSAGMADAVVAAWGARWPTEAARERAWRWSRWRCYWTERMRLARKISPPESAA